MSSKWGAPFGGGWAAGRRVGASGKGEGRLRPLPLTHAPAADPRVGGG